MIRSCAMTLLAVLVLAAVRAPNTSAQTSSVVEGVARSEDGRAPLPFALVRLIPADSTSRSGAPAQGITTNDGRFRFGGVTPGSYRVELLRIGFQPVRSDPVRVAAGETVQVPLRVAFQPVQLPTVTVRAEGCVKLNELGSHPQLLTLWQQARGGASIREGLMARFRYKAVLREESFEVTADGHSPVGVLEQPVVSDPKSALQNAARIRAQRISRGYYAPNDGWGLPNEQDVLHDDFLRTHCLEPSIERADGEVALRFRPHSVRRDFLDVRGTIWLDSATYLTRRIEIEYVDGEESRGTVRLDFGDVAVAGGTLRMPVGGAFAMRPSRKNPARRTEGKFTFTYSVFEEVRQP